jgi:flagellar basal-body rod protein FlgB
LIYRDFLFRNRLPLYNRALDTYALRQRTISKNIANATSPHYRPEAVKFEEFFHDPEVVIKGKTTDSYHIPLGKPDEGSVKGEVHDADVPRPEVYFSGETHVNIDKEMSNLAQNQIRFRFSSRVVKQYFQGLDQSITGIVR